MDGRGVFEFFKNSNTRQFPLTNMGGFGNKLEQGEALVCQYMSFLFYTVSAVNGTITVLSDMQSLGYYQFMNGEISLEVANSVVMKPIPVSAMVGQFNKDSGGADAAGNFNSVFKFNTFLIIPPLMDFTFKVQVDLNSATANTFVKLAVEGVGSILNTRQTV